MINPKINVKLYFFIHPKYHSNSVFEQYKFIDNLQLCFLKNKGFNNDIIRMANNIYNKL